MFQVLRFKNRGFTIIELIVVLAVFLLIIGTAVIIFISIIQNQKRILSEQELLNQISYVAEYMSKAIRMARTDETDACLGAGGTGYIYLLTRPDSSSNFYRGIKFINQSDDDACQEFYLDNSGPEPVLKEKKTYLPYGPISDDKAVPLTSEKLKINSVQFSINGSDGKVGGTNSASNQDGIQPRITIVLDIQTQLGPEKISKKIQTTVSQRNLNVK